jgi:hypothetical protein
MPKLIMSPMSLNINAKPFVSENFKHEMEIEIKWYDSKLDDFKSMNKFIFEDDENDLKFILSLNNTPFENVEGKRFKEKAKFKAVLFPLKEVKTWADIAA